MLCVFVECKHDMTAVLDDVIMASDEEVDVSGLWNNGELFW